MIRSSINRDLEINPALSLREGRHDAGRPVLIYPPAVGVLRVEPAGDFLSRLEAGPSQVDPRATQHVSVLRCEDQREVGAHRDSVQISDADPGQHLLVNPEDVSPFEPVGSPRIGQVSDLSSLGVRFVLVRPGPVARIKAHKGRDSSLAHGGVAPSLGVGGPAHPLVVEDGVRPHLIRHYDGLEGVGLQ